MIAGIVIACWLHCYYKAVSFQGVVLNYVATDEDGGHIALTASGSGTVPTLTPTPTMLVQERLDGGIATTDITGSV